MVAQNLLYRFNVYHGLSEIGLEEWQLKAKIADATETYLMNGCWPRIIYIYPHTTSVYLRGVPGLLDLCVYVWMA